MRRALTSLLAFVLISGMLLGAVACNSGESANNKPMLSVAQAALYCNLGESVTLPAATAENERDGDISASVKVTVYQGETVALAESAGNVEQTFTPSMAGNYVARYVVKNSAGVSSDIKEVNISVGEVPNIYRRQTDDHGRYLGGQFHVCKCDVARGDGCVRGGGRSFLECAGCAL